LRRNQNQNKVMISFLNTLLSWFQSLFCTKDMEITLIGLQNSGKSTLVKALAGSTDLQEPVPTIGFNMRKITKGGVVVSVATSCLARSLSLVHKLVLTPWLYYLTQD
jgi:hypothetical protein